MNISDDRLVVTPAKLAHNQRLAFIPAAHHYEQPGEPKYIKYNCPICEAALEKAKKVAKESELPDVHFYSCQVNYGLDCEICGAHLAWDKLSPDDIEE